MESHSVQCTFRNFHDDCDFVDGQKLFHSSPKAMNILQYPIYRSPVRAAYWPLVQYEARSSSLELASNQASGRREAAHLGLASSRPLRPARDEGEGEEGPEYGQIAE